MPTAVSDPMDPLALHREKVRRARHDVGQLRASAASLWGEVIPSDPGHAEVAPRRRPAGAEPGGGVGLQSSAPAELEVHVADRGGGRLAAVLSFLMLPAALVVMVVTLVTDSPQRDSSGIYFIAVFLALVGMGIGLWGHRRTTE